MKYRYILFVIMTGLLLVSCHKKPAYSPEEFAITKEDRYLGTTTLEIKGIYHYPVTVEGFEMRVADNESHENEKTYAADIIVRNFLLKLTNLEPSTEYYYHYVIDDGANPPFATEEQTFTTLSIIPVVKTLEVYPLDSVTVQVSSEVLSDGDLEVTERGVCWSALTSMPTLNDSVVRHEEGGLGTYTLVLEGLSPGAVYHVRGYAKNAAGTGYGEALKFVPEVPGGLPEVTTFALEEIEQIPVEVGGEVTDAGGSPVKERGVCWSTSPHPSVFDSHQAAAMGGTGGFTVTLMDLSAGTAYYVRAYAINGTGVGYGSDETFITAPPEGALPGLFSVSDNLKVWFSKGNLQYNKDLGSHTVATGGTAQGTWRFAEHQYDRLGLGNYDYFSDGWKDLFGWGTSGWNCGNTCYQPWSYETKGKLYGPPGLNSLTDTYANADWGVYNAILNGGNTPGVWRTLTNDEWLYVFMQRYASTLNGVANARFVVGKVDDLPGAVLFPDHYEHPSGIPLPKRINHAVPAAWDENCFSLDDWTAMEAHGAVFLPVTGYRQGNMMHDWDSRGAYHSATHDSDSTSYYLLFYDQSSLGGNNWTRDHGRGVRLVCPVL